MKSKSIKKASYFIDKYNKLDGKAITREKLNNFITKLRVSKRTLKDNRINTIYRKLSTILQDNPRYKSFKITLKKKFSNNNMLDIIGLGLPFLDKKTQKRLGEDSATGLNKSITNDDIYQMITDKIIQAIDDYGDLTWYSGRDNEKGKDIFINLPLPINYDSDKYYRGINSFTLSLYPKFIGFKKRGNKKAKKYVLIPIQDRLFWLTFKQIKDNEGKLKKNATSMQVVYYNFIYKNGKETISEKEYNKLYEKCKNLKKCEELKRIPFLKYYNVFNERDITGIDFDMKREELEEKATKFESTVEKIEAAESIIKAMPKRPKMIEKHIGSGESPYYSPSIDTVVMPLKEQYEEVAIWYGTAFHELVHSTGAAKRIGRIGITNIDRFGSTQYAFEELIAELGSAFLNGQSGILFKTLKKNSAYIRGWKKKVVGMLREDNKAIFKASAQAQKAANYILDYNKKGVPKYLQKIKKSKKKKQKQPKDLIDKNGQYALLGAAKKNNNSKGKVKIKYIKIINAEGFVSMYNYPRKYKSWESANKGLVPVYNDIITNYIGGYNKVGFEIIYQDGYKYEGRLDVSPLEDNPTRTSNVFGKHIKEILNYIISKEGIEIYRQSKKDVTEIKVWLKKYDLGTMKNIEPTHKDFKKGDKVFLINLPKIVDGRENPLYNGTGIVEHSQELDVNVNVKGYGSYGFLPKNLVKLLTIKKKGLNGATKNNPLKKLGFVPANSKITNPKDVFTLKGNLGKFIQKVQRVKELILLKGDKHSNKSQLAMQLANGFGELGLKVSYIDYEQGGLISKDTQNSKQWNTTKKGLENMQIVGFLDNPLADLELIAQNTDVIVVDSITDLRITANQMNDLRNKYQDVIWVFISQVKADGKMYGGNKMAHNPTKVIHCHTAREHNKRYATLEKNRGNDLEPMYAISDKKLVFAFKVFNGFDHYKGIDLFQVTGVNNDYVGEWHDAINDAKKELNDLVNSTSEVVNLDWDGWKK